MEASSQLVSDDGVNTNNLMPEIPLNPAQDVINPCGIPVEVQPNAKETEIGCPETEIGFPVPLPSTNSRLSSATFTEPCTTSNNVHGVLNSSPSSAHPVDEITAASNIGPVSEKEHFTNSSPDPICEPSFQDSPIKPDAGNISSHVTPTLLMIHG